MTVSVQEAGGRRLALGRVPGQEVLDGAAVVRVPIHTLSVAEISPRVSGVNLEHAKMLAGLQSELPAILVHRETLRVIDGVHRVRAARLRGEDHIEAYFFSGTEADAFVLAVKSNIAHGLPLSLAERKTAAERIIASHPQWSDRMIASITGISSGTVSQIRKRCADAAAHPTARIGHDGRLRPINGAQGRILASQLITSNPDLSLRQVARVAGISPETVRDVRNRLERGDDPVPMHCGVQRNSSGERPARRRGQSAALRVGRLSAVEATEVMERLRADPALRLSETGRSLLRLLHLHFVETREWKKIGENVPVHCSGIIARLARDCAHMWEEFADRVEEKVANVS